MLRTRNLSILLLFSVWLLLVLRIRPELQGESHDAVLYLNAAKCFVQDGLRCAHDREPLYPVLLAGLIATKLDLTSTLPVFQNLVFLISVFAFISSLFRAWNRSSRILLSLSFALVPTFLIPLNGAGYTEAISASLVFVFFALLGAYFRSVAGLKSIWLLAALLLTAFFLNLTKGSFSYVHYLMALGSCIFGMFWREKRKHAFLVSAALVISCVAVSPFRSLVQDQHQTYSRGGAILFGRTEYAARFSFSEDGVMYIVNGFSESACKKLYGENCSRVHFLAENDIGNNMAAVGVAEGTLFRAGLDNILDNPFRQGVFILMEWSKFVFHHGTTGFARLEAGVLGSWFHSAGANFVLKLLNFMVYIYFFFSIPALIEGARRRSPDMLLPAMACIYIVCYLLVYGLVTTVIRMIYPVAPLFLLLTIYLALVNRGRVASKAARYGEIH